jgi:hypothetical protein
MTKFPRPRVLWSAALFMAPVLSVFSIFAATDSLNYYFLYQRSIYLENTLLIGSWWVNPASAAEIDRKTLQTVNVTPLGNVLTIASAKYLTPVTPMVGVGVGIMGQGINPNPSLQAGNSGAQYQSNFSFINPSMQLAGAVKIKRGGAIGLLLNIGAEQLPNSTEIDPNGNANYFTMGVGAGYLTPWFFNRVSLGFSAMTTGHFWLQTFWDYDGKLAVSARSSDSLFTGSLEYTFSLLNQGFAWVYHSPGNHYEVVKALLSVRFMQIAGLLLGYSDDLPNYYANGPCAHVGLELKESAIYPFYGGYEIGIGLSQLHRDLLIHRLWVGYDF